MKDALISDDKHIFVDKDFFITLDHIYKVNAVLRHQVNSQRVT